MKFQTYGSIILFVSLFLWVIFWKPSFLFLPNGSLREFGIGREKTTVLPIWLIVIILAFLSYLATHIAIAYLPPSVYKALP